MSDGLVRWRAWVLVASLLGSFAIEAQGVTAQIAAGDAHSLQLRTDGTLWAWGSDSSGQLGQGRLVQSNTPTAVNGLPAISKFASLQVPVATISRSHGRESSGPGAPIAWVNWAMAEPVTRRLRSPSLA
jgi:hypothetical protein